MSIIVCLDVYRTQKELFIKPSKLSFYFYYQNRLLLPVQVLEKSRFYNFSESKYRINYAVYYTDIQNMLSLLRRNTKNTIYSFRVATCTFLFIGILVCSQLVFGQKTRIRFQADYDAKAVKFGYILGLPRTNYFIRYNQQFVKAYSDGSPKDSTMITSPSKMGIKMGGVVNFRIDDYFDFRIIPSVAIYRRELSFVQFQTNNYKTTTGFRENAWFELPFMLKYKSERRGNIRMYIFAGATLGFETNAVNFSKNPTAVRLTDLRTSDFSVNYGVGLEMFREYFKFAPELHFSHGMRNLIDAYRVQGTTLAQLDKLASHTVSLNFLFE
ncbi:MAG: PorT family protein [Spirosomaceae bacterium]|nr:PorT family protein [Spirosomataceae bacterium]